MSLLERTRSWPARLHHWFGRQVDMFGRAELGDWCRTLVSVPERWEGGHRVLLAVVAASAAFALGVQGSRALGLGSDDERDRAELAELARRLDDGRAEASALPALRQAMAALPASGAQADAPGPTAWQSIAALATRSGMTLRSVAPREGMAGGSEAGRVVTLEANASFASFVAFVSALSALPTLIVPVELALERETNGLQLRAALEIHDALPGVPVPATDDAPSAFGDPFGAPPALAPAQASELRLTGLMIEGTRSLAVIEADGQGAVYLPGQRLGDERLMRIGSASVTLARETATRVLTIGADS